MWGTGQQIHDHRIGGKSPPHQVNSFTNPNRGVEEGLAPLFLYRPLSLEEEEDTGCEVDNTPLISTSRTYPRAIL